MISSNKKFWNFVKPFLTNKGCMRNDFISIRNGDAFKDNFVSSVNFDFPKAEIADIIAILKQTLKKEVG